MGWTEWWWSGSRPAMHEAGRRRALALAALLAGIVPPALGADAVAEPPARWAAQVTAIPAADLTALGEQDRRHIEGARADLAAALRRPQVSAPDLAAAYARLGAMYQVHLAYAPAEQAFQNAHRLDPSEFRWAYFAGYLAQESGRAELALQRYSAAGRLADAYPPLDLRIAEVQLDLGRLEPAAALAERAAADPALAAGAHFALGQIALLERRLEAAAEHLERVLELDPEATAAHYPLAQALRALGRPEEARRHVARSGDRRPRVDDPLIDELLASARSAIVHYRAAMNAVKRREWQAAAESFAAGLALDPDNAAARLSYARSLYLSGDADGARRELQRVLAASPDQPLARFLLAVLDEAGGRAAEAVSGYRRVLALEPGHPGAHFFLANRALREGRPAEAERHYARTLAAEPANLSAYLLRYAAVSRLEAPDAERLAILEAAARHDPDDPLVRALLVDLLAGSTDDSVRDPARALPLARGLAGEAPQPRHVELLAKAFAASGDFGQAVDTLDPLVDLAALMAPPGEHARLQEALQAYRDGRMPAETRAARAAMLPSPAPTDPANPFRDYPAANPF